MWAFMRCCSGTAIDSDSVLISLVPKKCRSSSLLKHLGMGKWSESVEYLSISGGRIKCSTSSNKHSSDTWWPLSALDFTSTEKRACFWSFSRLLVRNSGKSSRLKPSSIVLHICSNFSLCHRPKSCRPSGYVMTPGPKRSPAWYRPWREKVLFYYLC